MEALRRRYRWLEVVDDETGRCTFCDQILVLNTDTCSKHETSEKHCRVVERMSRQPTMSAFMRPRSVAGSLVVKEQCLSLLLAAKSVPLTTADTIFSDELLELLRQIPEFPSGDAKKAS